MVRLAAGVFEAAGTCRFAGSAGSMTARGQTIATASPGPRAGECFGMRAVRTADGTIHRRIHLGTGNQPGRHRFIRDDTAMPRTPV